MSTLGELCDRCRYYKSVFQPEKPLFESKKETALRAIRLRKLMKSYGAIMEWEI